MASKSNNTRIILCLSLAFVLILLQAAATDLADITSKGSEETNGVADAKYPGGGYGGGPGGGYDNGGRGGHDNGGRGGYDNGGRSGYGGGRCRYGCCRRGYNGCRRCCSYAGEAVETTKP